MDIYSIFKFLHVICAIAWVGGGLTLFASALFAMRARGEMEIFKNLDIMNDLAKTWFIPASLLTVLFGAITTTFGGMWLDLWVILGLAGFAATFVTGITVFEPLGKQVAELLAAGRTDEALAIAHKVLRVAKFDYVVMFVVVADMVLKPHWTDFPTLIVFALAIGAGAYFFLYGGKLPARPATA